MTTPLPHEHKKCSACSVVLHSANFGKTSAYCKMCRKAYNARYKWTAEGVARKVWSDIQRRIYDTDKRHPSYRGIGCDITPEQWTLWAIPTLLTFWQAHPGERPSLDRLDPWQNYSLTNIRWLTKREHDLYGAKKNQARRDSQNLLNPPARPRHNVAITPRPSSPVYVPSIHPLYGKAIP
jgi:hypothetical protein